MRVPAWLTFGIIAILSSIVFAGIYAAVSYYDRVREREIPTYEINARKFVGNQKADIKCYRWGVCDVIPEAPMPPYKLYCNTDLCYLGR